MLQYKSKQNCKIITILEEEQIKKFIVKNCALLKNRSNNQFVCNLCLRDIKKDKLPKRSHKNSFKFDNFPDHLIKSLRKKCAFQENRSNSNLILDDENYERKHQSKKGRFRSKTARKCARLVSRKSSYDSDCLTTPFTLFKTYAFTTRWTGSIT